jgi:hypothetical protein
VSADVAGIAGLGNTSAPGDTTETAFAQQQQGQQQPGASWMNKRAEEEYHRAMEYVVDQDFNLGEFYFRGLVLLVDLLSSLVLGAVWAKADCIVLVDEFGDPFDERDMEGKIL